jgi:1,4-dihydroxy-2-naphthoyl-CoA synthase
MSLLLEKVGHVAILTLSRPEARNGCCLEFLAGFREPIPELDDDRDVHCVILTGDDKGAAFSAGATLRIRGPHRKVCCEFLHDAPKRRRSRPNSILTYFSKPVVAAVNGSAVGIGCILTSCYDLIVASERRMAATAGLAGSHAGAGWCDPRHALDGGGHAMRQRWVSRFGRTRLIGPASRSGWFPMPMDQARKVAKHISSLSPLAACVAKNSINTGYNIPLGEAAHATCAA